MALCKLVSGLEVIVPSIRLYRAHESLREYDKPEHEWRGGLKTARGNRET